MRSSDFSRQWTLWAEGRFGDKTLCNVDQTAEEEYADTLEDLGLSRAEVKNLRILDAGFGPGRLLRSFQRDSSFAVGLDLVRPHPLLELERDMLVRADLLESPFRPRQFDLVICRGVIHHTGRTAEAFRRLVEEVAMDGRLYLYIYEPNTPCVWLRRLLPLSWLLPEIVRLWLSRSIGGIVALLPRKGTRFSERHGKHSLMVFDAISPRYNDYYRPEEVLLWFKQAGFEARRIRPNYYLGSLNDPPIL